MDQKKTIIVWNGQQSGMSPSHDKKKYHLAKLFTQRGHVSPLCARIQPRKLDLKKELWTIRPEAVTCKKCMRIIKMYDVHS